MKQIIILIAFVGISFSAKAQHSAADTANIGKMSAHIYKAGTALKDFTRSYYTGASIELVGACFMVIGSSGSKSGSDGGAIRISSVGGVMVIAGAIVQLLSHTNIKTAGIELNKAGLCIPIN